MPTPNLTDINNYFAGRPNLMDSNIRQRNWRTNPWITMFKRTPFTMEDGRVPEILTNTYELPTAYPFGLPNQALSTGTGNPATVDATIVKSGHKKRNYQLEVAAFESEVIDLHTVQNMFQGVQQVKNKEKGLSNYATVWLSDWYRVHNIGMVNTKLSTTSTTSFARKSDALYDFSTLALPTAYFNWVHAALLYDEMIRAGAGEFKVGDSMGSPIFTISCGPGYKRELFQNDDEVRETINFSSDAKMNLAPRGITQSVNGFAPNIDDFPIRYAADGVTPIYPTINQATTIGQESIANPNYRTVDQGGLAVYEIISIHCRDIYTVKPRPIGPTQFGKAGFDATDFTGEIQWINNKDMATNKLGNLGFYRFDFQQAAMPENPEMGYSVLTLAKD